MHIIQTDREKKKTAKRESERANDRELGREKSTHLMPTKTEPKDTLESIPKQNKTKKKNTGKGGSFLRWEEKDLLLQRGSPDVAVFPNRPAGGDGCCCCWWWWWETFDFELTYKGVFEVTKHNVVITCQICGLWMCRRGEARFMLQKGTEHGRHGHQWKERQRESLCCWYKKSHRRQKISICSKLRNGRKITLTVSEMSLSLEMKRSQRHLSSGARARAIIHRELQESTLI